MIPNPQSILIAAGVWLASCVGVFFWAQHIEANAWRAKIAEQKVEAANLLIAKNKEAADKDNANIVAALEAQEIHDNEIAAINATADDYARKYTDSLRRLARCGKSGGGKLPAAATGADVPAPDPTGGADRLPETAGRDFSNIGRDANKLAATVRECVTWAKSVGR